MHWCGDSEALQASALVDGGLSLAGLPSEIFLLTPCMGMAGAGDFEAFVFGSAGSGGGIRARPVRAHIDLISSTPRRASFGTRAGRR